MYIYTHIHVGVKLDNASCEVLETVLSRVHANSLDLEKANLEDEVYTCRRGGRKRWEGVEKGRGGRKGEREGEESTLYVGGEGECHCIVIELHCV